MLSWLKKETNSSSATQERTLCDANNGQCVKIKCLQGQDSDCQRLREMGFSEDVEIEKLNDNHAILCKVCQTKVILSRQLAKNILISDEGDASMSEIKLLSELTEGHKATVHDFIEENDTCARLEEMGVTPGEPVEIIRYAPLGDPIEIRIRGYHLSLRKEEADLIQVTL